MKIISNMLSQHSFSYHFKLDIIILKLFQVPSSKVLTLKPAMCKINSKCDELLISFPWFLLLLC